MKLVLYQPEIPQNTGTLLRLGACLNIGVHIIEPCGFILNDRRLRRSGMDYLDTADLIRHQSWNGFLKYKKTDRCILLTPQATQTHLDFKFQAGDYLLLGQESCGVPESVAREVDDQICIPMQAGRRSLNIAVAGAIVVGEALRQTNLYPQLSL